ncbi:phosphatase PAP2 family protein [Mucilaginibacter pocheonensis]|uniref:Membrane-associated phospholipid phosphatase n=1 Tax=Mucilaginibacter pocheonensis TaxID=398050 RepID=A0ABU1T5F9_9SPHI|nr:phosphatase PAP2 family protein [Mucilaginibacter pocheonensis]MDR6940604.1 membrane-associated phospholipid phosphatase [Mucilaginibacter pocheonensis]
MKIGLKDVLYRISPFFILYLLLLCSCLIIKFLYSRETIYYAVNALNSSWADAIMPYITDIGEGLTVIILAAIIALFNYRNAFLLATSYAVTSIVAQVLKHIFDAPRPKLYFSHDLSHIHFVKGLQVWSVHSFPSGHSVTAFSAAVVITYLCKNKNWGIAALLVAMLVGYSRMYLSQHFFEDVIAGSVIGVIVTVLWLSWLDSKQFIHTAKWNTGLITTLKK